MIWKKRIVNGPGWSKLEQARKKFLAVGKACMAIFWPAPGFEGRTFVSSGLLIVWTLISASAVPYYRILDWKVCVPQGSILLWKFDLGELDLPCARQMKCVADDCFVCFVFFHACDVSRALLLSCIFHRQTPSRLAPFHITIINAEANIIVNVPYRVLVSWSRDFSILKKVGFVVYRTCAHVHQWVCIE